jgi:hypothetical protein
MQKIVSGFLSAVLLVSATQMSAAGLSPAKKATGYSTLQKVGIGAGVAVAGYTAYSLLSNGKAKKGNKAELVGSKAGSAEQQKAKLAKKQEKLVKRLQAVPLDQKALESLDAVTRKPVVQQRVQEEAAKARAKKEGEDAVRKANADELQKKIDQEVAARTAEHESEIARLNELLADDAEAAGASVALEGAGAGAEAHEAKRSKAE